MNFEHIRISDIKQETADTKTIFFDVPDHLQNDFRFKSGQYLTLQAIIDGEEIRRSYSISTAPSDEVIGVTVKRVKGGMMSNHIHNIWKIGDVVEVAKPDGHFIVEPDHDKKRIHAFIAAGSGITPVLSMVQNILEDEPLSICYILYGSRDEQTIIFKDILDLLEQKYSGQLFTTHTLSKPITEKEGGFLGIFKKSTINWKGDTGRISVEKIEHLIDALPSLYTDRQFYVCGPGDVIKKAEIAAANKGIDKKHIHKEYFSTNDEDKVTVKATKATITVHLNGEIFSYESKGEKPILEELIAMKKNPPYSCTSGACSSCMAQVIKGKVAMEVCYALDESEIEKGFILTCQAKPVSAEVELTYVA